MTARGWVEFSADDAHVRREREKARALRQTGWWRAQIARGVCHWCHKAVPPAELTMDHVVPLARGGRTTRGNVVPCCRECNQAKGARTPLDDILDSLPPPADDAPPAP